MHEGDTDELLPFSSDEIFKIQEPVLGYAY